MSGGTPDNNRYSGLDQINRDNVGRLEVAWTYDTGDALDRSEMQCNPLIVDGVLYATSPMIRAFALNAATGEELWSFDPFDGEAQTRRYRNRGLSYWASEDGADRRLYYAARHKLFALDAATGRPVEGFGEGKGWVDLREGLGRDPATLSVSLTSPGSVYQDLLIVGSIVSEGLPSAPGDIRAYDVRTGALRWTFHTIPRPGEEGHETWPEDAWSYTGGANNWAGLTVDVERGIVFCPTGSAAFDFYGSNREGDNLYANTLLALDAATGERLWHFQAVRHDVWDRDFPTPPALVTIKRGWFDAIDAVAQPTKSGHLFIFERETGEPVYPIEYRDYPASDIPGEVLAKQQPLPTKPEPFARQLLTEDMLTTRTPEAHAEALERFRQVRSAGQFIPPSREGTVIFPGFDGAAEWGGPAYDPETGILYVNSNEMAWILTLVPKEQRNRADSERLYRTYCANCHGDNLEGTPPEFPELERVAERRDRASVREVIAGGAGRMPGFAALGDPVVDALTDWLIMGKSREVEVARTNSPIDLDYTHTGYNKFLDSEGYPAIAPPWGTLNAIDLDTGEYVWKIPFGEFPELVEQGVTNTGSENYGGPVVTAGGLVFIGATNHDRKFRAYDKATGELLWETVLPAGGNATPSTYEVDGRQYVVIAAGGGKSGRPSGGKYVAFALPAP